MQDRHSYVVIWESDAGGWYCCVLVSKADPVDFGRAWDDSDYSGPHASYYTAASVARQELKG